MENFFDPAPLSAAHSIGTPMEVNLKVHRDKQELIFDHSTDVLFEVFYN